MKRILSIAAVFGIIIVCLCGCKEDNGYPMPTSEFYVNDFAEVISAEDEAKILSNAVKLAEATTAQVVVVTVEELDGQEPWEYALELGRLWEVGDEEKDNGIVILLSETDREIYISVGYGLEGDLPDSKTGRIIDVFGIEHLKSNDFSKGLFEISNAIVGEVYMAYGLETQEGYVSINNAEEATDQSAGAVFFSWLIMMIIVVAISFVFTGRGSGLFLLGIPHVGHHRGGFGGFGGFGGGSGGFRGGGGSFGGGGAGRRF